MDFEFNFEPAGQDLGIFQTMPRGVLTRHGNPQHVLSTQGPLCEHRHDSRINTATQTQNRRLKARTTEVITIPITRPRENTSISTGG